MVVFVFRMEITGGPDGVFADRGAIGTGLVFRRSEVGEIAELAVAHGKHGEFEGFVDVRAAFGERVVGVVAADDAVYAADGACVRNDDFNVERGVEEKSDLVARVCRHGARKDEEAAGADSPGGEGVSHVFVAAFEIEPGVGRIEEAGNADGGVGQETQKFSSAVFEFRLKETADHAAGEGKVVGRHVDAADHLFWKDGTVDP